MRIALAKILVEESDVLLLDEPTNYLDIESRIWLRNYINRFRGAYSSFPTIRTSLMKRFVKYMSFSMVD